MSSYNQFKNNTLRSVHTDATAAAATAEPAAAAVCCAFCRSGQTQRRRYSMLWALVWAACLPCLATTNLRTIPSGDLLHER